MRYCLVCPFVCLFVRHMCVRAYLFEPNFSLFHHVKISWISGILFRNRGILCSNRGILFRNRGILFRNRGILCRNHGILFKNRGILKSRRRRLLTRVHTILKTFTNYHAIMYLVRKYAFFEEIQIFFNSFRFLVDNLFFCALA